MIGGVLLTTVALGALLYAEYAKRAPLKRIAKPLASTGFILTAVAAGALESPYGLWILLGLALSMLGDVLLIPQDNQAAFRGGIASFLAGHLAYTTAFLTRGFDAAWGLGALALVTVVAGIVLRYLKPYVSDDMRPLVAGYVFVISAMVVSATASAGASPSWMIPAGALGFYLSDLAVARERFVVDEFLNRAWGLPLYYGAQLILAASTAAEVLPH